MFRLLFLFRLVFSIWAQNSSADISSRDPSWGTPQRWEYQRYDGWYNNLAHPAWGTVGSRLYRSVPSNYSDGVYMMHDDRPSARELSNTAFRGPDGLASKRNVTTMLAFFSQMVAYEIMQASDCSCPLEMHKISIPQNDSVFSQDSMIPFTRAKYDKDTGTGFNSPREQVNERTSWIDASFLYSTQEPWVSSMRAYKNGKLREDTVMKGYPPRNADRLPLLNPPPPQIHRLVDPERLFLLGDPRINENPGLLGFGLILYRYHNKIADKLKNEHPKWSDEELFHSARRYVIAMLQNIIMYEYLPAFLNEDIKPYTHYKSTLPPGVSHVFAAGAFRFPHSMVPSGMLLRENKNTCSFRTDVGGYEALRLCQNWWNAQDIIQDYSVDEVILGMASQITENEDHILVSDLRDFLFGPMHFTRRDLAAMSIMRGRDNGLPDYNTVRNHMRLPRRTWKTINPTLYGTTEGKVLIESLRNLYNNSIGKLDFYVGGMLEANGEGPGQLFKEIIKEQFYRIRDADRFWFENIDPAFRIFTDEEIADIKKIRLKDVIVQTTGIRADQLQDNVYFWVDGDPCPQPFQVESSRLEQCVPMMKYDHFVGNEVTFIFTCIGLGIIPILCIGIGHCIIKKRNYKPKVKQLPNSGSLKKSNNGMVGDIYIEPLGQNDVKKKLKRKPTKLPAIEWQHEHFCRSVIAFVCMETKSVRLEKRRHKEILRSVNLECIATKQSRTLVVYHTDRDKSTQATPFLLISFPHDYDMVLRFESAAAFDKFLLELNNLLESMGCTLLVQVKTSEAELILAAETREKRQKTLEGFFREAYARTFRIPELQNNDFRNDLIGEEILKTSLTRAEFAEALGMKINDLFVVRMFGCVARSDTEKITFMDFLTTLNRFTAGTPEQKLWMVFDMCDHKQNGKIDREEFMNLIRSINCNVGVQISMDEQEDLFDCVLNDIGIAQDQEKLTRRDFQHIVQEVATNSRPMIGLHLRGRRQMIGLEESESLNSFAMSPEAVDENCWRNEFWNQAVTYMEDYRAHIFWLTIFYAFTAYFFVERFWHYSNESEHRDIRRVMGMGIAVTRGAAAALSWCFGVILLTVCRTVMTYLRETALNNLIPFDAAITFHKIVAITAGIFAIMHTCGHCINFYHVATQAQDGLTCLFREAVFSSDFQPSISYWFYGTATGITGILLVVVMSIIYVFAAPSIINGAYHAFRFTHFLNALLYALTIAHGLPKLLDSPRFWLYILVPGIIFIIDRILSLRQDFKELRVLSAALLPSNIIYIRFKRPRSFWFRSGQWIRVTCPAFNCAFNERHAFSLASSPQDNCLELYIKAVGNWTRKLKEEVENALSAASPFPVLHMDGPYGAGNQEWFNHEISVLIGGGIGITPYASILTDLVQSTAAHRHTHVASKKVYFLWICSSHKDFEWFIDVLRHVEALDTRRILSVHIFITQFFHKFDLRTTMLYICERHFQAQQRRSMFTNLRAVNHFGRPDLPLILKHFQKKHSNQQCIGVFSCGPSSMNRNVAMACSKANRSRDFPHLTHKYETF